VTAFVPFFLRVYNLTLWRPAHFSAFLPPLFLLCAKHHPRGFYSNPPGQPTLPFVVTCRD